MPKFHAFSPDGMEMPVWVPGKAMGQENNNGKKM
jgi:hypothetical protein